MTEARDDRKPRPVAPSQLAQRQQWSGSSDRGQVAQPRNASGRLARPQSQPDRPVRQRPGQDQPPLGLPGRGQVRQSVPRSPEQHWPVRDLLHDGTEQPGGVGPRGLGPESQGPENLGPRRFGPESLGPRRLGPESVTGEPRTGEPRAGGAWGRRASDRRAWDRRASGHGASRRRISRPDGVRPPGHGVKRRGLAAPYALPTGVTALLLTGAFAAAAHGVVSAGWVLLIVAVIVSVVAVIAEPGAALFVTLAGWFTTAGFSRPPYAQLQVSWASGSRSALVLGCCGLAGIAVGLGVRRLASGFTLWIVDASDRDMLIEAEAQAEAWMESADPNGWMVPLPGDEQPTPTATPEPAKAPAPTDAATPAEATVPTDAAAPAEAAVPTAASVVPVQAAALADELPVPAQRPALPPLRPGDAGSARACSAEAAVSTAAVRSPACCWYCCFRW